MKTSKALFMKKGLVIGVAILGMLVGTIGPAAANAPGAGTFSGFEYPPDADLYDQPTPLCATFGTLAEGDPAVHQLDMEGSFHGVEGSGSATFTTDTPYDANPEGTYQAGSNCTVPAAVNGTMTIDFPPYTCSGDASYMRRGTSVYTLTFDGSCTDGTNTYDTTVVFTGTQVPCTPLTPCADADAGSSLAGAYTQIDG